MSDTACVVVCSSVSAVDILASISSSVSEVPSAAIPTSGLT